MLPVLLSQVYSVLNKSSLLVDVLFLVRYCMCFDGEKVILDGYREIKKHFPIQ